MAKPRRPTPEEKREAAQRRAGQRPTGNVRRQRTAEDLDYGKPVGATLFDSGPSSPRATNVGRNHTLGPIRVTEDLAERLAAYGNEHGLNQSDTVRELLARALSHHERAKRNRK